MADEANVADNADIDTAAEFSVPVGPKRRGRRPKKAMPDNASTSVALDRSKERAAAGGAKGTQTKAPVHAGSAAPTGDERDELRQLEQENQRLRKLLAEKLREENSALRRRLGSNRQPVE